MNFKTLLLLFVLTLVTMPAFATAATTDPSNTASVQLTSELAKMDDAQKAQVLETIRTGSSPTAKKAQEWVDIGNGIGTGLAATADKLGIAVNRFAESPVGKMAIFLIIWNYMGSTLIHLVGAMFCFTLLLFWWRVFRRMFGTFNEKGKLITLSYRNSSAESAAFITLVGVVLAACGFISILTA